MPSDEMDRDEQKTEEKASKTRKRTAASALPTDEEKSLLPLLQRDLGPCSLSSFSFLAAFLSSSFRFFPLRERRTAGSAPCISRQRALERRRRREDRAEEKEKWTRERLERQERQTTEGARKELREGRLPDEDRAGESQRDEKGKEDDRRAGRLQPESRTRGNLNKRRRGEENPASLWFSPVHLLWRFLLIAAL